MSASCGYEKQWYRLRVDPMPSNFVHNRHAEEPTLAYVMDSSQLSVLVTMQVSIEICRARQLGSDQTTHTANNIVARCKRLRGMDDNESEQ